MNLLLITWTAPHGSAAVRIEQMVIGKVPLLASQWEVSPDLQRVAYAEPGEGGRGARVVTDGRAGETFAEIRPGSLVWSADGKRIAYLARSPDGWHAVVDDRKSLAYSEIGPIAFSPDGSRYGFSASRGGAAYVVIDGDERGPYGGAGKEPPRFSPDGKRVFYANWAAGRGFLISDGRTERDAGPFGYVTHAGAAFSANGEHLAYPAGDTKAGTRHVVVDGVPTRGYHVNGIGPIALSDDAKHLAFTYQAMLPGDQPGDWLAVVNQVESQSLGGRPAAIAFSPDAHHLAIRVEARASAQTWMLLDGVPGKRYMRIMPGLPLFSADSRTCVYVGWNQVGPWKTTWPPLPRGAPDQHGESFLVVNGIEAAKWVAIGRPAFLADGRLAYGALDQQGRSFLVIDDAPQAAPFMSILIVKDEKILYGLSGYQADDGGWIAIRVEVTY